MFSVIYTPTEGDAIQDYSRLFRKPEGCFLNIHDQDRIEGDLAQFTEGGRREDIDYIVVTDGEEVIFYRPKSSRTGSWDFVALSDPRNR
jgi:malate dehydrogenase (oxaloacetate-decarboxylating)